MWFVFLVCDFRFIIGVGEILVLKEKEKGDWKKLTKEEKKVLY